MNPKPWSPPTRAMRPVLLAVALVLVVQACGGGSESVGPTTTAAVAITTTSPATTEPPTTTPTTIPEPPNLVRQAEDCVEAGIDRNCAEIAVAELMTLSLAEFDDPKPAWTEPAFITCYGQTIVEELATSDLASIVKYIAGLTEIGPSLQASIAAARFTAIQRCEP